jgi:chromosome segregation ATPase
MKELSSIDSDNTKNKSDNGAQKDKLLIEKLNKEIAEKNNELVQLQNKLSDSHERIHDIILEKGSLTKQINNFELKEIDIQFGKFKELKDDYNKLGHRLNVTKEQLDEARHQIIFHRKVIEDLENRGFMDYLRNRYPESFVDYKEKIDKS